MENVPNVIEVPIVAVAVHLAHVTRYVDRDFFYNFLVPIFIKMCTHCCEDSQNEYLGNLMTIIPVHFCVYPNPEQLFCQNNTRFKQGPSHMSEFVFA